jgi:hypothetical protein
MSLYVGTINETICITEVFNVALSCTAVDIMISASVVGPCLAIYSAVIIYIMNN